MFGAESELGKRFDGVDGAHDQLNTVDKPRDPALASVANLVRSSGCDLSVVLDHDLSEPLLYPH